MIKKPGTKDLSLEERKIIETMIKQNNSACKIAEVLSRGRETIYRELRRFETHFDYDANIAHDEAMNNRIRGASYAKISNRTLSKRIDMIEQQLEIIIDTLKELKNK